VVGDRLEEDDHLPTRARRRAAARIRAASSLGRGTAIRPWVSRSAPIELSLWKCPPKPFWYASPCRRTTIGFWNWPFEKNASEHASPRN
jgi:hypothetical protein